jgi:YfiH family protein
MTRQGERLQLLPVAWSAPANIRAYVTTRSGGYSKPPYDRGNLGTHVGDNAADVAANRVQLIEQLDAGVNIQWLDQVHGRDVAIARRQGDLVKADGAITRERLLGCAVMTADCLPLLLCDDRGQAVCALHVGWRGLVAGVIEQGLDAFSATATEPSRACLACLAWLGPAIGPHAFEVGEEVLQACTEAVPRPRRDRVLAAFTPSMTRPGYYLANLYELVRERLRAVGVQQIYGGLGCTVTQSQRYFSYRRDGVTGRMASVIYRV